MPNPVWTFDFTAPADCITKDEIITLLHQYTKKWVFQLEHGETYKHYQGRVSLEKRARSGAEVAKRFGVTKWHFSVTSTEHTKDFDYVTKEKTRLDGPWSYNDPPAPYIPRQIRDKTLYPWQQQIIDDKDKFDDRTINILYDPHGNNGKSFLGTYIGAHEIGRSLPFMNDFRDIMRMVMDTPKKPLYIIDIPRAIKKDYLFNSLELLKSSKTATHTTIATDSVKNSSTRQIYGCS